MNGRFQIMVVLAMLSSCGGRPAPSRPLDTVDLCKTHPDMCSICDECPCGGVVPVCCTEDGCVSWQNQDPMDDSIRPRSDMCHGTLALCQNGLGSQTRSDGYNEVTCYRWASPVSD